MQQLENSSKWNGFNFHWSYCPGFIELKVRCIKSENSQKRNKVLIRESRFRLTDWNPCKRIFSSFLLTFKHQKMGLTPCFFFYFCHLTLMLKTNSNCKILFLKRFHKTRLGKFTLSRNSLHAWGNGGVWMLSFYSFHLILAKAALRM